MSMKTILTVTVLVIVVLLASCADVEPISQCLTGHTYGFFGGLWHGFISMFAFIGSLFSDNISVWAVNNTGGWYAFGFLLGIGGFGGGIKLSIKP